MSWWGHKKTLHSKRNIATKWGGWKDEHDLTREGPVHLIQCHFWPEALAYTYYLVNRLLLSAIEGKILLKVWLGKTAQDYDLLWIFEYPAYYDVKKDKLDLRARKGIFMGFKKGVKGYKIWDQKDKKFILRRDITFDEVLMMKLINSQQVES